MSVGIVGGGPVGLVTGIQLLRNGFEVEVFEEHEEIGIPTHCAGIISRETLEMYEQICSVGDEVVLRRIKGLRVWIGNECSLEWIGSVTKAVIIDRVLFDKRLAEKFQSLGGVIHLKRRVLGVNAGKIKLRNCIKRFNVVIDAGGVKSYLYNHVNPRVLKAVQFEVDFEPDSEIVQIYFNLNVNRDFFYWIYPFKDGKSRIGTASFYQPIKLLNSFVKENFGELSIVKQLNGALIVSGPLKKFLKSDVYVVGDAAGQVKPLTGGGLRYGLEASINLSSILKSNSGKFVDYRDLWIKKWGKEINLQFKIRKLLFNLNDEKLTQIARLLNDLNVNSNIFLASDMDKPTLSTINLVKSVVKNLKVTPQLLRILVNLIR